MNQEAFPYLACGRSEPDDLRAVILTLTDFAPDHSLVAALQIAGLRNVFVTDWRSATPEMRFFSIDSYLADLNVVDELGGYANLIGSVPRRLE